MRDCADCGNPISPSRLEFNPMAEFCVSCADRHSPPVRARIIYSHKCDGELFVAHGSENIRRLDREYARAR